MTLWLFSQSFLFWANCSVQKQYKLNRICKIVIVATLRNAKLTNWKLKYLLVETDGSRTDGKVDIVQRGKQILKIPPDTMWSFVRTFKCRQVVLKSAKTPIDAIIRLTEILRKYLSSIFSFFFNSKSGKETLLDLFFQFSKLWPMNPHLDDLQLEH